MKPRSRVPRGLYGIMVAAALATSVTIAHSDDKKDEKPFDLNTRETVRVRLVTVDVVVKDGKDRMVPDLKAEDFELHVDGEPVKVDTLDLTCPAGAVESARVGKLREWSEPPSVVDAPRRVVLAFDYLHLPQIPCPFGGGPCMMHTQVLKYLQRTMKDSPQGNEEIMIVALDGALRVEQTFTRDRAVVLETLQRMEKDVTLWAGHFDHVTEKPLFSGLEILVDLLDLVPGSKALVLFTGGPGPGHSYDPDFRRLTDMASLARVSFYPIDSQGLAGQPFR